MPHVAGRMGAERGLSTYSRDCGITLFGVPQAAGCLNQSSCKVPRILGLSTVGRHKETCYRIGPQRPSLAPASCSSLLDLVYNNSLGRLAMQPTRSVPQMWHCIQPCETNRSDPAGQIQQVDTRYLHSRVVGGMFRGAVVCLLDSPLGMR
jgi:hypothetical protein